MKNILILNNQISDIYTQQKLSDITKPSYLRTKKLRREKQDTLEEVINENEDKLNNFKQLNETYNSFINGINTDIDRHFAKKRQIRSLIDAYNELFNQKPLNFSKFLENNNILDIIRIEDINKIKKNEKLKFIFIFIKKVWIIYNLTNQMNQI